MTEWKKIRLGNIIKMNENTYSPKENWKFINYLDTGNITTGIIDNIKYINLSSDKLPSRAKRKVKMNSIIYSTVRPNQLHYGIIKEFPDNFLVSTGFTVIDVDTEKALPDYIYYILTQKDVIEHLQAIAEQSVSAYPSIKPSDLENLEVFIPDIYTQIKVEAIISLIDQKIKKNREINNNLEQQAQAIFKKWFIDNPENFKWSTGTFSELIISTLNGDWGKEKIIANHTEKVFCIRGADIPEIKLGNKGKMPTRYILPKNLFNKQLTAGDIVVEISGGSPTQSTGRCIMISQSLLNLYDSNIICTNFCKSMKTKEKYSSFIYYYWQYFYEKDVFFSYENGTTGIKNLDFTAFIKTEPIFIPPFDIVMKFDDYCKIIFNQIFDNAMQNEKLILLKEILLPKLMSGEIDVSEVDI